MSELAWPFVALVGIGVLAWIARTFIIEDPQRGINEARIALLDGKVSALSLDLGRLRERADKSKELEDRVGKLELERGLAE